VASSNDRKRWVNLEIHNAILDHSKASGAGLALLLVMADHCNDKGECWASVATLRDDLHLKSDRGVQKLRQQLIKDRELQVIESGGGAQTAGHRIRCLDRVVNNRSPVKKRSPVSKVTPVSKSSFTGEETFTTPVNKRSSPLLINKLINKKNPPTPLASKGGPPQEWKPTRRERERIRALDWDRPELREFTRARCDMCEPAHEWLLPEPRADTAMPRGACPDYRRRLKERTVAPRPRAP
jgi:hypothetical protein